MDLNLLVSVAIFFLLLLLYIIYLHIFIVQQHVNKLDVEVGGRFFMLD